jgi:acetylglutamate kinase
VSDLEGGAVDSGYTVLKVGGAELQECPALEEFLETVVALSARGSLVVVHGGGAEIASLQKRLGLEPCFLDGLRITDLESLRVAEMVLSGLVNKRVTGRLVARGVRAIGLSGVDGGLLRARRLAHPKGDLGYVGEIMSVDVACLRDLLDDGFTPIVSPISLGLDGSTYNINADHAALAIAGALGARELVFLTDVPGVRGEADLLPELNVAEAERLIDLGVIHGGMIPKVRSALDAISAGVWSARITDLDGLSAGLGTIVRA